MTKVKPKSEWFDERKNLLVVDEILNDHQDAPLPEIVVYHDYQHTRHAEFAQTFEARCTLAAELSHEEPVEYLEPNYTVVLQGEKVPDDAALVYYFDAEARTPREEAIASAQEIIAHMHIRMNENFPAHGDAVREHWQRIDVPQLRFNQLKTPGERDLLHANGLNIAYQHKGTVLVWGNQVRNGAKLCVWVAFASALRYAYRRTSFIAGDPKALTRLLHAFNLASQVFVKARYITEGNRPYMHMLEDGTLAVKLTPALTGRKDEHNELMTIKAPVEGDSGIEMPDDIARMLDSLFQRRNVFDGCALHSPSVDLYDE